MIRSRTIHELHANCYLIKPVDLEQFITVLNQVVPMRYFAMPEPQIEMRKPTFYWHLGKALFER